MLKSSVYTFLISIEFGFCDELETYLFVAMSSQFDYNRGDLVMGASDWADHRDG